MANRKSTPDLREQWREKIKSSVLINRLMDHAVGQAEMTATQIKAAEILLKKTLPDIKAVENTGENGGPMSVAIMRFTDAADNPTE